MTAGRWWLVIEGQDGNQPGGLISMISEPARLSACSLASSRLSASLTYSSWTSWAQARSLSRAPVARISLMAPRAARLRA